MYIALFSFSFPQDGTTYEINNIERQMNILLHTILPKISEKIIAIKIQVYLDSVSEQKRKKKKKIKHERKIPLTGWKHRQLRNFSRCAARRYITPIRIA